MSDLGNPGGRNLQWIEGLKKAFLQVHSPNIASSSSIFSYFIPRACSQSHVKGPYVLAIELYPWAVVGGGIETFKEKDKPDVYFGKSTVSQWENGLGREKLGQNKSHHGSAWSVEGPAWWGMGQSPHDHTDEASGCGSCGLYLAGSWSCRTLGTWTCSSKSGGLTWAAVTSPATPVPRPTANPSSCTASLGSSASWPSASSWPAWWLPWSCGGTATGATRRPPKRSVP